MDGRPELDRFLRTDPRDVGCAQAMEMLHIYAELAAAGGPVEQRYPGIAAHLRACGPCGEDFDGLLAALRERPLRPPNWHPPSPLPARPRAGLLSRQGPPELRPVRARSSSGPDGVAPGVLAAGVCSSPGVRPAASLRSVRLRS